MNRISGGLDKFYEGKVLDDTVAREAGFNPYYPLVGSALGDPLVIGGKAYINLASNNYLGLANDSRLAEAAIRGIREYGVSMCATPIASGYSELFRETEEALSTFTGLEASLIFPSCYQANNGIFKMIAGPGDLVIFDRCAHSSLIEGLRGAGCDNRPFRHNDLGHLENILSRTGRYNQVFVATESVFSTEGATAPFEGIYALCLHHGAVPVVDDSHGIGVLGRTGRGILEHAGIRDYQGIYTASLGKALAVQGGVVSGKQSLVNYMRYFTSHLIYSTALMPAALKAVVRVLEIVDSDFDELSGKLWHHSRRLRDALTTSGYSLTESTTPINSIRAGDSVQTLKLTKLLFREGILSTPFIFPSVPEKCGRIRLIAGANLAEATIDRAIEIFKVTSREYHEMSSHT